MVKEQAPRLIRHVKFSDFSMGLFEQFDLMVDYPYAVIIESTNKAFGIGRFVHMRHLQVEALSDFDDALQRYAQVNDRELLGQFTH